MLRRKRVTIKFVVPVREAFTKNQITWGKVPSRRDRARKELSEQASPTEYPEGCDKRKSLQAYKGSVKKREQSFKV